MGCDVENDRLAAARGMKVDGDINVSHEMASGMKKSEDQLRMPKC